MWANLIFLVTLVIPNRDLPHQLNVCTEKVVKMKRDKNVAIFLRNFAHCAIMILIMLQQHLRNGFKIFLNSPLNFHTFDYFMSDIRCFPKFQLVTVMLLQFRFLKKATKHKHQINWEISSNFVAFLENLICICLN